MSASPGPQGSLIRDQWIFAAACVALVLVAFAPVFGNGFVHLDDTLYITSNVHVRQGLTWENVRWAIVSDGECYWHPLTWLSLMADVQVFGMRPGPIHAVNVALHIAAALLLFAVLARMTGRSARSAAVALLFAVHPLQVESVAWAAERKTVLASALGFGALLAYARWVERPRWTRYAAACLLYAASLLAKPLLVTLPVLFLLLDVWPLGRTRWARPERLAGSPVPVPLGRLVAEKVPFVGIAVAVAALVLTRHAASIRALSVVPVALRVANAFTSCWWYVEKIAWPSRLAPYYPQRAEIPLWLAAGAAAGLLLVLVALFLLRRRVTLAPAVGWVWFLVVLAPSSGIVRSGLWPGMADRFAYVPIVGVLIAIVWGVGAGVEGSRTRGATALAAAAAAALVLATQTHAQAKRWRDSLTLFEYTVAVEPNPVSWWNLGYVLGTTGRVAEAITLYERAVAGDPNPMVSSDLGHLLESSGRVAEALTVYERAIAVEPNTTSWADLGRALESSGRVADARPEYEREARVLPNAPDGPLNLGVLMHEQGDLDGAEREYRTALSRDPGCGKAYFNLGLLQKRRGERDRALDSFQRAIDAGWRDPNAFDQLGQALLALGREAEAERAFQQALRVDPVYWRAEVRLGQMMAGGGRTEEATRAFAAARRHAAPAEGDEHAVDRAAFECGIVRF